MSTMLVFVLYLLLSWNGGSFGSNQVADKTIPLQANMFFPTGSQYPPFKGCQNKKEILSLELDIPKFSINLDDAPEKRWVEIIKFREKEIKDLLASIKNHTDEIFNHKVFDLVDKYFPLLAKSLPTEYYEELLGISKAINIPLGEVTLFNVFYEFFSVCTSIVMEGTDGKMYHGRNLDFGLFLGWDIKNNTWLTTEYLKSLVVRLEFTKSNKTVYSAINFAGYIGVLTAVKKNMFSLTVNERFILDGGYVGLIEWILGYRNLKWMGILTRDVMLSANTYTAAQKILVKEPLVAPVYFILAGNKSRQGCIITRGHKDFDMWSLGGRHEGQAGGWYLVQTNYDHWRRPPAYDDRRSPAVTCMEQNGPGNPLNTLMNVLSTRPVLNKLTTYTALMDIRSGKIQVKLQSCENPCWPW